MRLSSARKSPPPWSSPSLRLPAHPARGPPPSLIFFQCCGGVTCRRMAAPTMSPSPTAPPQPPPLEPPDPRLPRGSLSGATKRTAAGRQNGPASCPLPHCWHPSKAFVGQGHCQQPRPPTSTLASKVPRAASTATTFTRVRPHSPPKVLPEGALRARWRVGLGRGSDGLSRLRQPQTSCGSGRCKVPALRDLGGGRWRGDDGPTLKRCLERAKSGHVGCCAAGMGKTSQYLLHGAMWRK